MDKLAYKKQVLAKAKERQQEIIDDFRTRIQALKDSEMNINEGQYDHDQQSLDASSNELINNLADELNFVVEEMNFLNKMQVGEKLHQNIAVGSVVKTDKRTFFPCVSIEKFRVNGDEFFGISSKAPVFNEMKDKQTGDSFSYNQVQYRILEVY